MAKKKLNAYEQAQRQFVQSRIAQSGQEATPELRARFRQRFENLAQEKSGRTKIAQRVLADATPEERKSFKRTLANELPSRKIVNTSGTTAPTAPSGPITPSKNMKIRDAGARSQLQVPKSTAAVTSSGGKGDRGKYTVGQVLGPVGGYIGKTASQFAAPLQGKSVTYEPSPVFKFAEEKNIPVVGRIAPGARELSKGTWAGTAGAAKQIGLAGVDYYFLKGGLKAAGYGLKKVGGTALVGGIKNLFGKTTTGQVARDLTSAAKRGGTALRGSKGGTKGAQTKPIEPVKVDKPTSNTTLVSVKGGTKTRGSKASTKTKEVKVEPAKAESKPIEPVKVDKPTTAVKSTKSKGGTTTRGSKANPQKKSDLEDISQLRKDIRAELEDPWSVTSQRFGRLADWAGKNPEAPLPHALRAQKSITPNTKGDAQFGPMPGWADKTFVKQYESALDLVKSRGTGWQQAKVFVRTQANIQKYGKLKGFK
jgi:hypothetical protein